MLPSWNQLFYAVSALSKAAGLHQRISISIRTYARVTWDQALFWFRFLINIPAGMAKRKEILAVAVRENVWEPLKLGLINARAEWHIWLNSPFPSRLRVVPHISSRIVERVKRERAWKSPHARNGDTRRGERKMIIFLSPRRVSPFLAWGDFHALSRFARWPNKWSKVTTLEDKPRSEWPFFHKLCEKYYRKSCTYMRNNSTKKKGKKKTNNFTLSTKVGKPWREKGGAHFMQARCKEDLPTLYQRRTGRQTHWTP